MTHFKKEQWEQFIHGEIDSVTERRMESHLQSCENCLSAYEVEALSFSPPGDFSVEDEVMKRILSNETHPTVRKSPIRFWHKTVTHFAISAAAAIMLAGSGVFTAFIDETPDRQGEALNESHSFTASLLEQTDRFFSQMDPSPKEELE
ncbi:zf-HC2 domain-containing protein [Jeotgalibacillus sp. ET6]|uniref:zf-HC2 domain-containing protein n=1 Tax=Jeotgalibacillus sp. ET6 TaxID=3037260 RepID=UPI002418B0FB|nr:zf-HC2 domain-containing protein [Jeotgalibacillus sp. ET6]MDG5471839.1 zf-HC2 domain-containing protein [Jeotgalibacillus sp. ET6]